MVNLMDEIDLQLFDDGGAGTGAGTAGADGAGGAGDAPTQGKADRQNGRKPNPLANVQYGRTAQSQQGAGEQAAAADGEPSREEWEQLKKGRFAKLYGEDVSSTVRDRLKNSKQSEESLGKLKPMLERMAGQYGIEDAGDIDSLMAAYNDDDSLYEEEAIERGVSVATLKSLKKLERANAQQSQEQAAADQKAKFDAHIAKLEAQAQEMQAEIPGFDLREALQDPEFRRLTDPERGLSVQDAYFALHRQELMQGMAQTAIRKTKESMAANIQSGQNRPRENGTRSSAPSLDVKTDPRTLTRADREEIRRRVRNGEKIYF